MNNAVKTINQFESTIWKEKQLISAELLVVFIFCFCASNSYIEKHKRFLILQYLGLVVGHLLYQRLISKLLGATSVVLGGVGRVLCHDGWPGSCSRMHHCRRARWVMLVWSLLLHVWYCKLTQQNKKMQWETSLRLSNASKKTVCTDLISQQCLLIAMGQNTMHTKWTTDQNTERPKHNTNKMNNKSQ